MSMNGSRKPAVVAAHMGARMHYALPVLLNRAGLLSQFYTDAYAGAGSWLHPLLKVVPTSMMRPAMHRLSHRTADLPANKVTAFNMLGIRSSMALQDGGNSATSVTDTFLQYARLFSAKVTASPEMRKSTMVYTKVKTVDITKYAHENNITAVVEQNSTPLVVRSPMWAAEDERWAGWQKSGMVYRDEKVWMDIEADEWAYADIVVAPSAHIRDTLTAVGVPVEKIRTIPYAISTDHIQGRVHTYDGTRKLRVLFVGRVDLNKGTPYLLRAIEQLGANAVDVKVVGSNFFTPEVLRQFDELVEFTGRVSKVEVKQLYEWADIFVLPSLSEGSATVTYEARAFGLPVIATPNSGSWLRPEEDGLEIPAQDTDAIAAALTRFLDEPEAVERMSRKALDHAGMFSWEAYQLRLTQLVHELHGHSTEATGLEYGKSVSL